MLKENSWHSCLRISYKETMCLLATTVSEYRAVTPSSSLRFFDAGSSDVLEGYTWESVGTAFEGWKGDVGSAND